MRALDAMLHESDKRYHQKLNEERQFLRDEAKKDHEAWQKTIGAYRTLLEDACTILENVFDKAQTEYSQGIFYSCWCVRACAHLRVCLHLSWYLPCVCVSVSVRARACVRAYISLFAYHVCIYLCVCIGATFDALQESSESKEF